LTCPQDRDHLAKLTCTIRLHPKEAKIIPILGVFIPWSPAIAEADSRLYPKHLEIVSLSNTAFEGDEILMLSTLTNLHVASFSLIRPYQGYIYSESPQDQPYLLVC
jgi:hypothetical protein